MGLDAVALALAARNSSGGSGLTLGETSTTAYRGDRGKIAYDHSQTTGNPHETTAEEVGAVALEDYWDLLPQKTISNQSIASFNDGADNVPVRDLTISIVPIQAGSGDPSPSNIRAITGWTGVTIYGRARNLCTTNGYTNPYTNSYGATRTIAENGEITISGTNSDTVARSIDMANTLTLKAGTYKLSGCPVGGGTGTSDYWLAVVDANNTRLARDTGSGYEFTINADRIVYTRVRIPAGFSEPDGIVFKPMLRLASDTDTEFVKGVYNNYTVSWRTAAGTVYGGMLDVTTGVLTVDCKFATLNENYDWVTYSSGGVQKGFALSSASAGIDDAMSGLADVTAPYMVCNLLPIGTVAWTNGYCGLQNLNFWFAFGSDVFDGLAAFKSFLHDNPVQIVYPLNTPITYQLTPTEVKTLLGVNNIWADTGNVAELIYCANPNLANSWLPSPPTTDGDYVLTADISSGVVTYSWEPVS